MWDEVIDGLKRMQLAKDPLDRFEPAVPRKAIGGEFLAPVPLDWLSQASALPGKALAVGVALWFLVGCRKTKTVALTHQVMAKMHVGRKAAHRGLALLEKAGLVQVRQIAGRSPVVTILASKPKSKRRRK
jgi:hypothetical protein